MSLPGAMCILYLGIRSNSDQQSLEYEQQSDSDLSGQVLELRSINDNEDIDTYIQPSFYHYGFYQSPNERHQFANSQNLAIPKLNSASDETLFERHKRDVAWIFDTSQTLAMDGSGTITEEESKFSFPLKLSLCLLSHVFHKNCSIVLRSIFFDTFLVLLPHTLSFW